jgi:hypothetical protein
MTDVYAGTMQDVDYDEFEDVYDHYVSEKLREAEIEAASPDAKWTDYREVLHHLNEKYRDVCC